MRNKSMKANYEINKEVRRLKLTVLVQTNRLKELNNKQQCENVRTVVVVTFLSD